jgi:hypothetical protein
MWNRNCERNAHQICGAFEYENCQLLRISKEAGVENGFGISKCDLSLHASLQISILQRWKSCSSFKIMQRKWWCAVPQSRKRQAGVGVLR